MTPQPPPEPTRYETNDILTAMVLLSLGENVELLGHERRSDPETGRRFVVFFLSDPKQCEQYLKDHQDQLWTLRENLRVLRSIALGR